MQALPPTAMEMDTPAIRQHAFIVPQEYGRQFTPKTVQQFDYVPNTGISIPKGKTQFKVKEALDNEILNDSRLKNIGNMSVTIKEGLANKGEFDIKANKITLRKGSPESMQETLYHEIQHAIDKKTGTNRVKGNRAFYEDNKKPHNLRIVEQSTETNDILIQAEKQKNPITWLEKQIKIAKRVKTEKAKSRVEKLKMALKLLTKD